jgi:tetratricopeptide (TPR) repeat protein
LQSAELLKDRALLFVVQHRWKEAAADLSKAAELDPSNNLYRFLLAPLQVQIGDTDGYRLNCAQLLARFGDTADPINAERVAKPCLILPDAGVDLDAVGKLAEISVSKGKNHPFFAYFMVTKALAELRQGHFASAIDWMQQFLAGAAKVPPQNTLDRNLTASAHLIMAMAEHHLKREKEARASLASGSDLIDPEPGINGTWNDWLVAQALLKEARALIEGQTTTAK